MGDHPSAVTLYASIVTALLKRERTGKGSMVHTSLLANGLWSAACIAQAGFAGGTFEAFRASRRSPSLVRHLYAAKDGRFLQFTMIRTAQEFADLLRALGLGDMADDKRFDTPAQRADNAGLLVDLVREAIAGRNSQEWLDVFALNGVNVNRVAIIEELIDNEQVFINAMVVPPADDSIRMPYVIDHPLNVEGLAQAGPKRAPDIGEHSNEILEALGYSSAQIDLLRERGVV